jgi:glutamate formiminotransferase / 5-formyltetrahydrofolate cyclo-ligase
MARIVECVPNISEGKDQNVITAITDEVKRFKVRLLDVESDRDHNRSVITYVGEPEEVEKATFALAAKAVELIDMEKHKGEHPRIGALDVVPFVPISGVTMPECVAMAERVGKKIWEELKVPVYLYEEAAKRPECQNLAEIRKGEYEGLKDAISLPGRRPDFGEAKLHPSAGATVVGAREPLVAFNVNLGTKDINIAKKIAQAVRFSSGGFRFVKAMGFDIKEKGYVQVSMNLTKYKGTPVFRVYEAIKSEADRYGVPIIGSEVIGLIPLEAMVQCADFYLKLENFKFDQILEVKLYQ